MFFGFTFCFAPCESTCALRPFEPVGQLMPFASQPTPKHHHYEVAGFVHAFFASSRFCATIFWVQNFCRLLFYDFIMTSPADSSVIQCRFVVTRRCRVQARPKNGHRSGGGNKKTPPVRTGLPVTSHEPSGEGQYIRDPEYRRGQPLFGGKMTTTGKAAVARFQSNDEQRKRVAVQEMDG
jgi:hypothetical protein